METKMGRPLKFNSPEEITTKGQAWIDQQKAEGKPLTITGLAFHLGASTRETLMDYQDDRGKDFSDAVKRLKIQIEMYAEEQMYLARNPAGAIFALKNYRWKDRTETDITSNGNELSGLVSINPPKPKKD